MSIRLTKVRAQVWSGPLDGLEITVIGADIRIAGGHGTQGDPAAGLHPPLETPVRGSDRATSRDARQGPSGVGAQSGAGDGSSARGPAPLELPGAVGSDAPPTEGDSRD